MARVALTAHVPTITGTVLTYTAADAVNGHEYTNTGKEILLVRNDDVADTTITVLANQLVDTDLVVPDRTVVVSAGTEEALGPYSKGTYNTGTLLQFDVSNATSVTFCLIQET